MRSALKWLLLGCIPAWMLALNPIRFHQTASADGLTMQVPVLWTPMKTTGKEMPVALRREWSPFLPAGIVNLMDRTQQDAKKGPWSLDEAHQQQTLLVFLQGKDHRFSEIHSFDTKAGIRTAVCEGATLNGADHALICYIVGTPLQFSFEGSPRSEPAALKMLASLK
jgi:hypothetical protein